MKKFNFKKNYFFSFFIFIFLILNIFFPISPKIIQANNLFLFNDFSFKFPPVNVGSVLQRKSGPLIVNGFRSTSYSRFDSILQIPEGAGAGKVLTSDAEGNATWQVSTPPSNPIWGSITGTLTNQTDLINILNLRANLDSPIFVNPRAPTAALNDNDTSIATTEFVQNAKNNFLANSGTWTDLGDVVRLSDLNHNISLGSNTILFKGSVSTANRFIHHSGTNNLYMGKNTGVTSNGQRNTGIGASSFTNPSFNQTNNTGVGFSVLNGTMSSNVAIGASARGGGNGNQNTAVGYSAISSASGNTNTAVGYGALTQVSSGQGNTSIGALGSINFNITGSNNTLIGYASTLSSGGLTNASAIGYGAQVQASNRMIFGKDTGVHTKAWGFGTQPGAGQAIKVGTTTSNGNGASLTTAGVWTSASDLNKKTNIQNLNYGLKEVLRLRPVSFDWKDSNTHDIGFIAQEVKEVIPELVYGTEGDLSLAYSQIPVVLVNAIAEQNQELISDQNNFIEFEKELKEVEMKIKNAQ